MVSFINFMFVTVMHCLLQEQALNVNVEGVWTYEPFSDFHDKSASHIGFYPSGQHINTMYTYRLCTWNTWNTYTLFMDQYVLALTGHIIKWDHSFKLPNFLMKVAGEIILALLFTFFK